MTATTNDVLPVATRNLVGYLEDESALHEVTVTYGPPRDLEREQILIGDSDSDGDVEWATIGPSPAKLNVDVSFSVTAVAFEKGMDATEAFERAVELRSVVERVIRDNSKLGLPTTLAPTVSFGRLSHTFYGDTEGVGCAASLVVRITTRL